MGEKPPRVTIRACRKTDYAFFYRMVVQLRDLVEKTESWQPKWVRESFDRTWKEVRVVMKGKRRIGIFLIHHRKDHTELARIYISPAYQNKGIGSWLMEHFEDKARAKGHKKIRLEVWPKNPAKGFYERRGYMVVKTDKRKIHMEKRI